MSQLSLNKDGDGHSAGEQSVDEAQSVLGQIADWLQEQKNKKSKHGFHRSHRGTRPELPTNDSSESMPRGHDSELDLSKLEAILSSYTVATGKKILSSASHRSHLLKKDSAYRKKRRPSLAPTSSDTDQSAVDLLVPNVEANLDNSKTMAYSGGEMSEVDGTVKTRSKDQKHWLQFKQEIIRLTHTLQLKGWRRIPIENGNDIKVSRLSGALTNAVYVVAPPKEMPVVGNSDSQAPRQPTRAPAELLLRIYGPQVEHLIDRDSELAILRRLARKRIGPRLLGTFTNGRFEEFLHAKTLTAVDIRDPNISKQIAKRMRELHDGIELLQSEFDEGPRVFHNWNQWVSRCEQVITWLDKQVKNQQNSEAVDPNNPYTRRGFICGVEWPLFRKAVEQYQIHLHDIYGGKKGIRDHLVFAHNDTQYGNLLRLTPEEQSPMLLAANEHKRLVVIDFEYASQNTTGLEFANHFTEWCYDYHHPQQSYVCNSKRYPTPEEQHRFVRSYVMHRPQFNPAASATPKLDGRERTNIPDFMLDARGPPGPQTDYDAEERARLRKEEDDIQQLLHETRQWRPANTAQWVAWGIVQAKIPELDEPKPKSRAGILLNAIHDKLRPHPQSDPLTAEEEALKEDAKHDRPEGRAQEEAHDEGDADDSQTATTTEEGTDAGEEEGDFDYLAYAQERAMFFWGDCLQMGFVKLEDFPVEMRDKLKIVRY